MDVDKTIKAEELPTKKVDSEHKNKAEKRNTHNKKNKKTNEPKQDWTIVIEMTNGAHFSKYMEYSFPCLIDVTESIQKVIQYIHQVGGVSCEFARVAGYWKDNCLFFSFLVVDRKEYYQDKKKKKD